MYNMAREGAGASDSVTRAVGTALAGRHARQHAAAPKPRTA